MQAEAIVYLPLAERTFNRVELSIVLVKKAMSFSGLTRESTEHSKEILASSARMTTVGFSLVELSIVLVILGLLTGGILTGQNLIRNAELRSVVTEFQAYQTAVMTFRDKYFALPGDMPNATDFWGEAHATPATCYATQGTGTQTCNGNGDGKISDHAGPTGNDHEIHRFWQHLANAGLLEGSYTGVAGAGGVEHSVIGNNAPRSKISNAGFSTGNIAYYPHPSHPGDTWHFEGVYNNVIWFGTVSADTITYEPAITPEEAWNIDTKIDDGKPAYGSVMHYRIGLLPGCLLNDTPSTAEYNLSNNSVVCSLIFRDVY